MGTFINHDIFSIPFAHNIYPPYSFSVLCQGYVCISYSKQFYTANLTFFLENLFILNFQQG